MSQCCLSRRCAVLKQRPQWIIHKLPEHVFAKHRSSLCLYTSRKMSLLADVLWLLLLVPCRSVACSDDVYSSADPCNEPDECQSRFMQKDGGSLCCFVIRKDISVGCCFVIAAPCFPVAVLLVQTMCCHLPTITTSQTNVRPSLCVNIVVVPACSV